MRFCSGRWILLFVSVIIIVFRERRYFAFPRFWAEEGVIFFTFAHSHGVFQSLFQPHLGYYSFYANLASILSVKLVSLEDAPLVTTTMALIGQCLPLSLVIFGQSPYWQGLIRKTAVLLVIFLAPLSYEVWLNSINTQFYLCLFAALLLLEPHSDGDGTPKRGVLRVCLLVAGLTGIMSCLLTPLYWLRAYVEKQKELMILAIILTACSLIQVAVVVMSTSGEVDSKAIMAMGVALPSRSFHWSPPTLGSILLVKTILLDYLGPSLTVPVAKSVHSLYAKGGVGQQVFGYGSLLGVVSFWGCLLRKCSCPARYIVPGSFVLLVVPSVSFALVDTMAVLISPYAAQRYFFVPNVLMLLMLCCAIQWNGIMRLSGGDLLLAVLFSLALFWGVSEFRHFSGKGNVYDLAWPHWKDEVAVWRKDSTYPLKIWPAPQWKMRLDP